MAPVNKSDTFVTHHLLSTVSSYYVNYFSYHNGMVTVMDVVDAVRECGFMHVKRCRASETLVAMGKFNIELFR